MNKKITRTVFTALFMALCCGATFIYIPAPVGTGYLNLGDCLVILSGWMMGPVYGFIAAGIGSAISDVILGYAVYAPATLIVKGLMALTAYFIMKSLKKILSDKNILTVILSAFVSEVIMVGGYYLYESLMAGNFISALGGIPGNAVQGTFGLIASSILMGVIEKSGVKNSLLRNIK